MEKIFRRHRFFDILLNNFMRRQSSFAEDFANGPGTGCAIIFALGVVGALFSKDKSAQLGAVLFLVLILAAVLVGILFRRKALKDRNRLRDVLSEKGLNSVVENFIESFGKEVGARTISAWRPREGYAFDWKRLEDFRDELMQRSIHFVKKDYSENKSLDAQMEWLLKEFIDKKERTYLTNRVSTQEIHSFSELNKKGDDFEHLIVRLFEAMGYSAKRIGGVGDQGGDVIAVRKGHSCLTR